MAITSLSVQHIRSHDQLTVDFSPHVTVITGPNGSGKTSLLEAIYLTLQGSSFKGSDKDLLQVNEPWWRVDVTLTDDNSNETRTVKFDPSKTTGRKQFIIDNKTNYRLPAKYKLPIVLFDPDDLRLLNGSPARRRLFIDRFISQLSPTYAASLRKYERALKQRNNLLKKPYISPDELFAWNVALSEYGATIIEQRILFIEQINAELNTAYNDIAKSNDTVAVHYSHTLIGDGKQKMLHELETSFARDRALGSTGVGPHRHDLIFTYNQLPALSTASRGEVRTIVLALKFLEVDIIKKVFGARPLILLDDVFSELDITRQKSLSDTIREHQIIITSTHVLSDSKEFAHIRLN